MIRFYKYNPTDRIFDFPLLLSLEDHEKVIPKENSIGHYYMNTLHYIEMPIKAILHCDTLGLAFL